MGMATGQQGGAVKLTVREYAERERVTTRTVYRWIDKGAVEAEQKHGPRSGVRIVTSVDSKRHL